MVWAGVSANARTDLVFINGHLNGQRYINELLTPHVLSFLRQMPDPNPIFQDDNALPHRALPSSQQRWQIELACHVSSFILHRARLGCAWNICIGSTRQEQHSARPSAISCERSGPGSRSRPSENSFSLQRTESVNAGVTMMAIHIINIWDTFLDNPVGITGCWQATRLTFQWHFDLI